MWSKKNKFCGVCGSGLVRSVSGSGAKCPPDCARGGHVIYPSTSPVGIVSISNVTNDHLLLIRQPRYPAGMYSCIAGFLDSGETLEVRLQLLEEQSDF